MYGTVEYCRFFAKRIMTVECMDYTYYNYLTLILLPSHPSPDRSFVLMLEIVFAKVNTMP